MELFIKYSQAAAKETNKILINSVGDTCSACGACLTEWFLLIPHVIFFIKISQNMLLLLLEIKLSIITVFRSGSDAMKLSKNGLNANGNPSLCVWFEPHLGGV